jgi:hypothetical protein
MKKFGTPSGAGPGRANENVGLDGVGTPGPVGPLVAGDFGFLLFFFFFLDLPVLLCVVPVVTVLPAPLWSLPVVLVEVCCEGFLLPFPDELELVEVLEGVDDVLEGVDDVLVGVDDVVVVTVGTGEVLVVVLGWQEAVTLW